MTLLLSRSDVQSILRMKDAIQIVEKAFEQLALGNAIMPQRTVVRVEDYHGIHLGMPAYIGGDLDALALKVVTVYHDNPAKHKLPTTIGTLLLSDPQTGAPLAVMDAGYLTAMRTGAASGVATKHLAREQARSVGVFGAGVQADTQLWAVATVRDLNRVTVYDQDDDRASKFKDEWSEKLGLQVSIAKHPKEAVEGMDVLIAATSAAEPIFEGGWVELGTHINGIGSHTPATRELDSEIVQRSRIIPDFRSACLAEAGDLIIPISEGAISEADLGPDLGEVVAGLKPGRENEEQITLFKSVGLAIQDVSTASHVYNMAVEKGIGQDFDF